MKANDPIPAEEKGKMLGTLAFMSIRCHDGKKATFMDDIECFVYTLMFLAAGTLPWMQIHVKTSADYHRIRLMKEKLDKDWFKRHNVPIEIFEILQITRSNDTKIDYLNIKFKLLAALKAIGEKNDFDFDWCSKNSLDNSPDKMDDKVRINQANQLNQKIIAS